MAETPEIADDSRLALLVAARDRLVEAMSGDLVCRACSRGVDPPLAGVIRELRAVLTEIDMIPGSGEVSPLDILASGIVSDLAEHRRKRATG